MKKFTVLDGAALVVWLLPAIYLLTIYSSLPQTMALHYDFHGNADQYGSKKEFLTGPFILIGISGLVYLLLRFLKSIDPKKQVRYGEDTFNKLALGIIVFLAALNIGIIYAAAHHGFKADKLIFPIMGLLFAFVGNIMNSIKPNYFAGVRTPWTLENDENWRATHRLAGKLWFIGGLAITVLVLFLPGVSGKIIFMSILAVMVFIPVIYSYVYFRKHNFNRN